VPTQIRPHHALPNHDPNPPSPPFYHAIPNQTKTNQRQDHNHTSPPQKKQDRRSRPFGCLTQRGLEGMRQLGRSLRELHPTVLQPPGAQAQAQAQESSLSKHSSLLLLQQQQLSKQQQPSSSEGGDGDVAGRGRGSGSGWRGSSSSSSPTSAALIEAYASNFARTQQSAQGLLHGMGAHERVAEAAVPVVVREVGV
jgi:hypothetical protein